mmetsp:Transcript_60181/g.69746  ORF Transcript_60181/g.69746 Transcript_60181/m.69746 type:complete len:98 (+) Transcript_60181:3-296(+)
MKPNSLLGPPDLLLADERRLPAELWARHGAPFEGPQHVQPVPAGFHRSHATHTSCPCYMGSNHHPQCVQNGSETQKNMIRAMQTHSTSRQRMKSPML